MAKAAPRERKVWLYMADGRQLGDLARLDSAGFDTWKGNPQTRSGDLILMYRTAPYKDLVYVFLAVSDSRPVEDWYWKDAVDIGDGYRLPQAITRAELKKVRGLKPR